MERTVCRSATCASGREDRDQDGVPDWVEVVACNSNTCASSTKDSVGDGIPDFARQIVCGSATCYTGNADVNGNGVPLWASVVICGTTACATGHEDYDADGVSDAIELTACVVPRGGLASTGSTIAIWLIVALGAGLITTGLVLARKRHLFAAAVRTDAVV
ncbi:LPXTG cell wall anchor domain-containing protein [Leifsonia sp. NPDC014704]|uniref:LPXTG cell wall anchor domain-containing protein n=1 Tax=Leifsonia sp. NPDC014704 TaxID=3364123 RepID=UPI0036F4917A